MVKKRNNKDNTSQTIRECLENATDINAALAHRFEYHIFHAGDVHRIGRVNHEDIYPLIGEWVGKRHSTIDGQKLLLTKPIHIFMDGRLWSVLELLSNENDRASFSETSIMFGLIHEAEVLEELRVLTWNPDEASEADEGGAN